MDVAAKTQVSPHCLFISLRILYPSHFGTNSNTNTYLLTVTPSTQQIDRNCGASELTNLAVCNYCNTSVCVSEKYKNEGRRKVSHFIFPLPPAIPEHNLCKRNVFFFFALVLDSNGESVPFYYERCILACSA